MKIVLAEALRVKLTMRVPFEISSQRFQEKDAVLVRLKTADGIIGYGESGALPAPFYSPEYIDGAYDVIARYLLPSIIGQELNAVDDVIATYSWIKGHHFAKVAVEGAYWHLVSLQAQVPLREVWGGELARIEVGTSLSIQPTVAKLVEKVAESLDAGFRRIKIKIKPGFDVAPVAAIRERFGDDLTLMVDANSGYTLAPEHRAIMKALDDFGLLMIEQPLAHDDIIDHATLQRELQTPICLDESIHTFDDARHAIALGACRIINIKPPRVGGFDVSRRIAAYARAHDVGVWCGGMFETGIGKAFNAHLCSLTTFNLPADNSGSRSYYPHDLLMADHPMLMNGDAHITLPTTPGLGWPIDEEFIQKNLVARETFVAGTS